MEWNWDATWWRKPTRRVKPTPAGAAPVEQPSPRAAVPHEAEPQPTPLERGAQRPLSATRPFYSVYFLEKAPKDGQARGDCDHVLDTIEPGIAARIVEMLYVPAGRSGSSEEAYLLYECPEEFQAACRFAALLEAPAATPDAADAGSAFRAGLDACTRILGAGAIVDAKRVERCEKSLGEAAEATSLTPLQNWAAAVLAGRVVADYRYDYGAARRYFALAQQHAPSDLEKMTAAWWQADALMQEGRRSDAHDAYAVLVETYENRWPKAHVVRRSESILDARTRK